jgi:hypothetical protein
MMPKEIGRKHKRIVMKPLSAEAQGRQFGVPHRGLRPGRGELR